MHQQEEKDRVNRQINHYDDLIAAYIGVVQQLNKSDTPEDAKVLIELANESMQHCQNKRAILVSHLHSLAA